MVPGQVDLAELDGPFVKLRLKGKFWHTRATVVARIGNYLKNRIPVSSSFSRPAIHERVEFVTRFLIWQYLGRKSWRWR
jgi:hypothetical protein